MPSSSPHSPRHTTINIDNAMGSPPLLSPSRAIGPHSGRRRIGEAEAMERQRQQDLESAMMMSRARSSSIVPDSSPALRPSMQHYHSSSPIEEADDFPMLSHLEEREMHAAQYGDHDAHSDIEHPSYRPDEGHEELMDSHHSHNHGHGQGLGHGQRTHSHRSGVESALGSSMDAGRLMRRHSDEGRRHERGLHNGHDHHEGLGHGHDHSHGADRERHEVERRLGLTGGVGGQIANSNFLFEEMEEFAAVEREKLGLSGPIPIASPKGQASPRIELGRNSGEHVGSWDTTDNMPRTTTFSALGDDEHASGLLSTTAAPPAKGDGTNQNFARRRQRKLSQSNPVQRRGGKLALFEGFGSGQGGEDGDGAGLAVKAPRLPKNSLPIGNGPTGGGIMPYSDNPIGGHDRPYRFSFYSNALPVTIHARTLAELPGEGQSFEDLFKGKNSMAAQAGQGSNGDSATLGGTETPRDDGQKASMLARAAGAAARAGAAVPPSLQSAAGPGSTLNTPGGMGPPDASPQDEETEVFTWWLDVLSPTDEEMRMLSKVFGIHPLTTEDILLEETREKIELFRNYYLVCFRSFDQDPYSQTYLEPLNMYIIVFREGTLSFHFRGTPHPQNVRRRIKHLKDYISVTSDWISYALIDDITDAFGPLIQSIEYEVDSIDELVLILKDSEQSDMLRRIGTCRKKVMGLLRLMGNKADVVKGLAKRCNEQWLVAPKSDIGLYLSDIQDHLITMTQNLNHYEKILSRSHSNYLAQISIEMTDANNQINDVLSKLTALGTVLIPMNLVTGLWGMNVHVPGQDIEEGYQWFGGILGCLMAFAVLGAFATYKCFVVR